MAMPPLTDPNFDRSIVFMLEHSAEGAIGVVLNRPTPERPIEVGRWLDRAGDPARVFAGGPVETQALIGVAERGDVHLTTGWAPLGGDPGAAIGTVDLALDPIEVPVERLRIFRGYAGWGAQQLEGEIAVDAWAIVDFQSDDLFTAAPEGLWRAVLGRQPTQLSWLAHFPSDVSVN